MNANTKLAGSLLAECQGDNPFKRQNKNCATGIKSMGSALVSPLMKWIAGPGFRSLERKR